MTAFRLAGFRAVRVDELLDARADDARATTSCRPPQRRRRGVRERRARLRDGHEPGLARRRLSPTRPAREFASYAAAIVRGAPSIARRHRRQRAEPQPLLASAVRPRRLERRARRLPRAPRADVRRAQGGVARRARLRRRRLAARDRPSGRDPPDALADAFIRELGLAYRASGRDAPGDGRATSSTCTRDNSSQSPDGRAPAARRRSASPTTRSSSHCSARRSTARRSRAPTLPIVYGEFGVESQIPASKAALYTGTRADDDEARRRGDAGDVLPAGARARVLPADRRGHAALPLARRAGARRLAVGDLLRDGTPKTSRPRVTAALDRTTGGSITRCPASSSRSTRRRSASARARPRSAASFRVSFRCDLDCRYWVRLENAATHCDEARGEGLGRGGRARARPTSGRGTCHAAHTATRSGSCTR